MNLTHAPAEQLANARKSTKRLKGTGLDYARLYTSWNSRSQKVRVKFYWISYTPKQLEVALKLGFRMRVNSHTNTKSFVGEF